MGLDPITVTLSSFEKLEILRSEIKAREQDLTETEKDLRKALRAVATQRFLKSLAPYYNSVPLPPEAVAAPDLEAKRQALYQVIQAIRAQIPRLESTAMGAGGGGGGVRPEKRRNRFESF
jgi:hypothetical protein